MAYYTLATKYNRDTKDFQPQFGDKSLKVVKDESILSYKIDYQAVILYTNTDTQAEINSLLLQFNEALARRKEENRPLKVLRNEVFTIDKILSL